MSGGTAIGHDRAGSVGRYFPYGEERTNNRLAHEKIAARWRRPLRSFSVLSPVSCGSNLQSGSWTWATSRAERRFEGELSVGLPHVCNPRNTSSQPLLALIVENVAFRNIATIRS
jgi:hypothetical protein